MNSRKNAVSTIAHQPSKKPGFWPNLRIPTKYSREHLTFAAKLEIGVRSQESGARRKESEGSRKEPEEVFLQI
jgi:hypothetical protein